MQTAYLALDAHANSCVLGLMNQDGTYQGDERFPTAESELVPRVAGVEADTKRLAVEEGPLAFWIGRTLEEYVDEVLICDPRENHLISRSAHKSDRADAYNLCRLLRLGELNEVYHAEKDHRAIFKAAARHYLDVRKQQTALKQKIKATFRAWGVMNVKGKRLYHPEGRKDYLPCLPHEAIRDQLLSLYELMDAAVNAKKQAKSRLLRLGSRYPEIDEFRKMPGIGPIGSHLFDAFIQTPHRFPTKQKLWRYSQLGIRSRSSDGKPLGYEELDPEGRGELKDVSYRAFQGALRTKEDNEVRTFYEQSLRRTHNKKHARLNTQRKILMALWTIWKNDDAYKPKKFLGAG